MTINDNLPIMSISADNVNIRRYGSTQAKIICIGPYNNDIYQPIWLYIGQYKYILADIWLSAILQIYKIEAHSGFFE